MAMSIHRVEIRMLYRFIILLLAVGIIAFSVAYRHLPCPGSMKRIHLPHNWQCNKSTTGTLENTEQNTDTSVADELAKKVRVLCWVMTQPSNHEVKAKHVKATWGKRCNILLFMSSVEDESLPAIKLPFPEEKNYLWGKTKSAFRFVHMHYRNDADWFMKADDDTYVIVENLRYMLEDYNTSDPIYFGFRFNRYSEQGYMSGGAGYVLSRNALDKLVEEALPNPKLCKEDDTGAEDAELGKCLAEVGVKAMDTRDSSLHGRFFPFTPMDHLFPSKNKTWWYWTNMYYPTDDGLDCCSNYAITFHYITPEHMYVLEYLIYELRPYGINYRSIPKRKNKTLAIAKFKPSRRTKD